MSGGNKSHIHKAQFRKTLYVECMKHNRQQKVNFLAGKQNMKQFPSRTFLVCEFSVSLFYAGSGRQAPVSATNLLFCRFSIKVLHIKGKRAKIK